LRGNVEVDRAVVHRGHGAVVGRRRHGRHQVLVDKFAVMRSPLSLTRGSGRRLQGWVDRGEGVGGGYACSAKRRALVPVVHSRIRALRQTSESCEVWRPPTPRAGLEAAQSSYARSLPYTGYTSDAIFSLGMHSYGTLVYCIPTFE